MVKEVVVKRSDFEKVLEYVNARLGQPLDLRRVAKEAKVDRKYPGVIFSIALKHKAAIKKYPAHGNNSIYVVTEPITRKHLKGLVSTEEPVKGKIAQTEKNSTQFALSVVHTINGHIDDMWSSFGEALRIINEKQTDLQNRLGRIEAGITTLSGRILDLELKSKE